MQAPLHARIRLCDQLKAYNVLSFYVKNFFQEVTPVVNKNAFSILMNNDRVLPDKLREPKNNVDILYTSPLSETTRYHTSSLPYSNWPFIYTILK